MTSISYKEILESFLGDITDTKLVSLEEEEIFEVVSELLSKALAEPYLKRIFSNKTWNKEEKVFSFELKKSDEDDADFVTLCLTKWLVYEWLHNQVRSVESTAQFFGTKEAKYYSQANHLSETRGLMEDAYKEARSIIAERGYIANATK